MKIRAIVALAVPLACMSARADNIYVESRGGANLFVVNSDTGDKTSIGSYGPNGTGLGVLAQAFSPNGTLYAVLRGGSASLCQLVTVDPSSGGAGNTLTTTSIGFTGVPVEAMAFTPDGTLYAANFNTNNLYTLNLKTGAATLIGNLGFDGIMDMAWDPFSFTMYAVASLCDGSAVYSIDLISGAGTKITDVQNPCLMTLAIDSSNRFLSTDFSNPNSPLYKIDLEHGTLDVIGSTGLGNTMGATAQPEEGAEIQVLEAALSNLNLDFGITNSLNKKLAAALDAFQADDTASACVALQDFLNEVNAQSGKKISSSNASNLLDAAAAIRTLLGC